MQFNPKEFVDLVELAEFDEKAQDIKQDESKIKYKNLGELTFYFGSVCLGSFYAGWVLGQLSAVTFSCLAQAFGSIATSQPMYGILQGIISFGAIFGSLITPSFMRFFTRRQLLLGVNLAILITLAMNQIPNVYVLLVTRFFIGVWVGAIKAIFPIYINDLCPKQILTHFGVILCLYFIVGLFLSFFLAEIFSLTKADCSTSWRLMFGSIGIFILYEVVLIVTNIIPESPNSLIRYGRNQEAKALLSRFYKQEYLEEVYQNKIAEVQFQIAYASGTDENIQINWWVYLVAFELMIYSQLVGINAVTVENCAYMYQHSNLGQLYGLSVNGFEIIGTLAAIYLNDKVGRRPILVFSNAIFLILNITLAFLFYFMDEWASAVFWILIVSSFYAFLFGLTVGSTTWFYIPELVPDSLAPYFYTTGWIAACLVLVITPIITSASNDNPYVMFIIFSAVTFIALIVNFLFLIETKGLEKIEVMRIITKKSQ